jgi:hypothetical protein
LKEDSMTKKAITTATILIALVIVSLPGSAAGADNPFIGRWALTLPDGRAGWLGVTEAEGILDASLLWRGGSVVPVASVYIAGDTLHLTRVSDIERDDEGGIVRIRTEEVAATVSDDTMKLTRYVPHPDGMGRVAEEFLGKRIPPLPPKPNLSKVRYGKPVNLLKEDTLDGWTPVEPDWANGWSVENGVLVNKPVQPESGERIAYANLRTVEEFEDFNLKLEVSVGKGQNSGVYLRGIYEVQVEDTYGREVDSHNMGAIYSRITPRVAAEKPAGEWQTLDITLLDRHVTVKLNGTTIIDNEPLLGCTGGALWADESLPGPIYLQGDHGPIKYRNIVLTPILK